MCRSMGGRAPVVGRARRSIQLTVMSVLFFVLEVGCIFFVTNEWKKFSDMLHSMDCVRFVKGELFLFAVHVFSRVLCGWILVRNPNVHEHFDFLFFSVLTELIHMNMYSVLLQNRNTNQNQRAQQWIPACCSGGQCLPAALCQTARFAFQVSCFQALCIVFHWLFLHTFTLIHFPFLVSIIFRSH